MRRQIAGLLLFLLLFESSCAHVARVKVPSHPLPVPRHLLDYYRYEPIQTKPVVHLLRVRNLYVEKRIIFRGVEDPTGHRSSLVIHYYEPKAKKQHPLILITPILGKKYGIERSFANYFAKRGFACAIVHRRPLRLIPDKPLGEVEAYFRSSIIRLRMALDWLEDEEKIDPTAIGTFGISFGGVLNTVLGGVDRRTKCHLIALAGGELSDVICYSHEKTIRHYRNQFMKLRGVDLETFRKELREAIVSEPIAFAHFVDARNVFLFIAWFDFTIGKKHARKLAKAFGYPEIYYVPLGHYTSLLAVPFIRIKAVEFFESHLKRKIQ